MKKLLILVIGLLVITTMGIFGCGTSGSTTATTTTYGSGSTTTSATTSTGSTTSTINPAGYSLSGTISWAPAAGTYGTLLVLLDTSGVNIVKAISGTTSATYSFPGLDATGHLVRAYFFVNRSLSSPSISDLQTGDKYGQTYVSVTGNLTGQDITLTLTF